MRFPGEERLWRRLTALGTLSISQYGGDVGEYPPTVGLIDDSDAPNASNFNTAPQGVTDRTAFLNLRFPHPGLNWHSAFTPDQVLGNSDLAYFGAGAWNDTLQLWIVAVNDQTTGACWAYLTSGLDGGAAAFYAQIGSNHVAFGAPAQVTAVAVDPNATGGWAGVVDVATTTTTVNFVANSGAAWSTIRTLTSTNAIAMATYGGYLIYFANGTLSSTADQGSTWSDFATGLGSPSPYLAVGPNAIVAAAQKTTWSSADGVTWTAGTIASGANTVIAGLVYDAARSLWIVVIDNTSTFVMQTWSSADGITWTQVSSGPSPVLVADAASGPDEAARTGV